MRCREKELKRKAAIKENEQTTSKKEHGKSEQDSLEIFEGSQDQHEPGAGMEKVKTGVRGKDEHSVSEDNRKSSLHLDNNNMTLDGGDDGNDDLGLTPCEQSLCDCFKKGGGNLAGSSLLARLLQATIKKRNR